MKKTLGDLLSYCRGLTTPTTTTVEMDRAYSQDQIDSVKDILVNVDKSKYDWDLTIEGSTVSLICTAK